MGVVYQIRFASDAIWTTRHRGMRAPCNRDRRITHVDGLIVAATLIGKTNPKRPRGNARHNRYLAQCFGLI
jgi:hypothetical protein